VLETIAILLVAMWALGMASSVSMGGLVHVLLLLATVAIAIRLTQGRRI
jgi:hypothetical protein